MSIILPKWIAHRGLSARAPENTLEAFALAEEEGYLMFECDVQLRKDEVPVIVHDDITKFGAEETAEFPSLAVVLEWMLGNKIAMNLELKGKQVNLSERVIAVLRPYLTQLENRILISSFEFSQLQKFKALCPELAIGLLIGCQEFKRLGFLGVKKQFDILGAVSLNIDLRLATKENLSEFLKICPKILVYTVSYKQSPALLARGVTGVFTNG